jgi:type IV secretion system protein VirB10
VRRLNRLPLALACGAGVIVATAVGYTYHLRAAQSVASAAAEAEREPKPASGQQALAGAPESGHIETAQGQKPVEKTATTDTSPPTGPAIDEQAIAARTQAWAAYYQALQQRRQQLVQAETQALTADPTVSGAVGGSTASTAPPQPNSGPVAGLGAAGLLQPVLTSAATPALPGAALAGFGGQYGGGLGVDAPQVPAIDANGQRSKQAFLAQPGATGDSDYLQASLKPPVSPFEVQAGAVIPAVMIGGVVSDLAGQLIAQVAETVYDSVTGNVPLIPQGSRLVGTYDNQVAAGQTRVLVVWNRVIFPNGWSIDIGQMPGADQGGYAGFHDQVNNHFWQIFGNAVMLSLFGAGVQLSQPQASGFENVSAGQTAASALGIQMAQLGQQYASRGLSIPPTLEVRPGYRFVIMVTKDMVLPGPWRG